MQKLLLKGFLTLLVVFLFTIKSTAYDSDNVHPKVNEEASRQSTNLKMILTNLGFNNGVDSIVNQKEIYKWFREGGIKEDNPLVRSYNHFHDPTKSWDKAGLRSSTWGDSSILWGQDSNQKYVASDGTVYNVNGTWSWQNARAFYRLALTSSGKTTREQNLAYTFRALGHVMHLLADASVPEHTRDDIHVFPLFDNTSFQIGKWTYETWCKYNLAGREMSATAKDYSITNNSLVSGLVPITNFWDTTPSAGYNLNPIGLAEYSNFNFLSKDTIFKDYTYPQKSNTKILESVTAEDQKPDARIYLKGTTSDSQNIDHLVSTGYLWNELSTIDPSGINDSRFNLDDKCFKDYAAILVPKAVGYSAGLLNYFFRGGIDMVRDTENDACQYVVYNFSNENMKGDFGLYYDDASGNRTSVASGDLTANAGKPSNPITLDIAEDLKNKSKYILVFQGKMGNETGAVVADAKVTPFTSSCGTELTISGAATTSKNSTELYTVSGCTGCSDDVTWGVSGAGARIETSSDGIELKNSIKVITDDTACGTITITANCPGCGIDATKTVTISDTLEIIDTATPDCYAVKDGTGSYTWSITKGTINENGCVDLTGQCGTATITVTDACGNTGTRDLQLPDKLTITGPDAGKCYSTTGTEPYQWSITKGTINANGCVNLTGQCGTATIGVTDANGCMGEKGLNIPAETLTITGSETTTKNSTKQYTASGCGQVEWSISPLNKGAIINKTTGLLTTTSSACGSFTITALCPACSTTATKGVRVTDGGMWNTTNPSCSGGDYWMSDEKPQCAYNYCEIIIGKYKYDIFYNSTSPSCTGCSCPSFDGQVCSGIAADRMCWGRKYKWCCNTDGNIGINCPGGCGE